MKFTNSGSNRQRIVFYYIIAVVLPGFLLGYMAFRGIRNDQALREKESRKRLEMKSEAFFAALNTGLFRFTDKQPSDFKQNQSENNDPSLLAWVVRDTSGLQRIIFHKMLYLPDEQLVVRHEQLSSPVGFEEGMRLEFAEDRFSDALLFYQNVLFNPINEENKIQSLVASARLLNKLNQPEKAKEIYKKILREYPEKLLNGQIPLKLIAGLEILKINKTLGEFDEMKINARKYLEFLLYPSCEYNENQFDHFYQSINDILSKTDPVIDSLFRKIDSQKVITENILSIIRNPELLVGRGNNHIEDRKNEIHCISLDTENIVVLDIMSKENAAYKSIFVIDFPVYLFSESEKILQNLDPDFTMDFMIEDKNSQLVFSRIANEATGFLTFNFPENLPQWKLLLWENKPGFLTSLWSAGSGIYLYIFILIVILMVLGFVFTLYTLNGELRLNKLKSEFISNVSHELKSPLTTIRLMTEMLHNNRVLTDERKSAYYLAMIDESERLSHLIDNILDFSRMDAERKKYDFKELDLDELILNFLETIRQKLYDSGFDIRYICAEKVPFIKADKDAIIQVFYNLIDNAIKFSGTSRKIDISLISKNYELLLSVKDYGIGISAKDQERIFDRFYRSNETQKLGIKGSGIGLTIVKKIVEAHNGYLTVKSNLGEGSTFTVGIAVEQVSSRQ